MKINELFKSFAKDKKLTFFVALGIAGIIIIAVTTFFPAKEKVEQISNPDLTIAEYETQLEKEMTELVSMINGVGKVKIMVTLNNGVEHIYAKEEKQNSDITNGLAGDNETVQKRDNYEQKTILIEDENGHKTALLRTTLEPTVRGVVVICEGGDDILVQQNVTDAVKIALGVGANKVCVTKITN